MTTQQFISKWRGTELKERSASQSHSMTFARCWAWGDDLRAGQLTDDETLSRLFRLNLELSST
jgi:hypothetical protein